jgi:hypothetical protein
MKTQISFGVEISKGEPFFASDPLVAVASADSVLALSAP